MIKKKEESFLHSVFEDRAMNHGFKKRDVGGPKKISKSERLDFIDFLKGFACIMMIFAHFSSSGSSSLFFGEIAPFVFFMCIGITTGFSMKKKTKLLPLIIIYLLFFIFSLSSNFMRRPDELINFQNPFLHFDFFQIIAVGTIFLFLLYRFEIKKITAFFIFILILLLHYYNQNFRINFGKMILFSVETTEDKISLFTIIPWLAVFVFGFIYRDISRISLLIVNIFFIIILYFARDIEFQFLKWDTSFPYFFYGIAFSSILFHIFIYLSKIKIFILQYFLNILGVIGKLSMIFVYAHFFIQSIMKENYNDFDRIFWGAIFSCFFTLFLAIIFNGFNKRFKIKNPILFFIILFFLPFIKIFHYPKFIEIYYFAFGILMSVKFRELSNQIFGFFKIQKNKKQKIIFKKRL